MPVATGGRQQKTAEKYVGKTAGGITGGTAESNCAAGVANAKAGVNRPSQNYYYFFLDTFLAFFFAFFFAAIIVSLKLT